MAAPAVKSVNKHESNGSRKVTETHKNPNKSQVGRLSSIHYRRILLPLVVAACTSLPARASAIQDQTSVPSPGDTEVQKIPGSDVEFKVAYIPTGSFTLGSPASEPGRAEDEGPQRRVHINAFWMMTHEVTNEAYSMFRRRSLDGNESNNKAIEFSADAVSRPSPPYEDPSHGVSDANAPASGMTQWAAIQFARWLYTKTGAFYRLPTEAEWEYACRAGTISVPSGKDLDSIAWHWNNSGEVAQTTGLKESNAWGLYDILGNVSEWTMDQYKSDYYSGVTEGESDPQTEITSPHPRTVRGGAYDDDPEDLRCANRIPSTLRWKRRDPQVPKSKWWNTDSPFVGFRLIRPIHTMNHHEIMRYYADMLDES